MGLNGVQRTLKFAKYMKDFKWEPTVLTAAETGHYLNDFSLLDESEKAGIEVVRVGANNKKPVQKNKNTVKIPSEIIRKISSRLSSIFFIPDNKNSWCKKAILKARELLKNEYYDLLFVTGPPFSTFVMAAELKEEFNLPLVIDYRDLWFGNQGAFYPSLFHKYLHKKLEYKVLKAADKITATNRRIKEKLLDYYKFLTFEDIFIINHGYDPADFENLVAVRKTNSKMILLYSGTFYEFITPKYFLRAFKQLAIERPDVAANIELHFVGVQRKETEKLIRKLGLQDSVKQFGFLSHKESLVKIISCDVLWMMVGHSRNIDAHSPGKLYSYYGARKPILANIPEGVIKNSLMEYNASFITSPDNIDEIKDEILKIYRLYISNQLPQPSEDFILKHRCDILTDQLTKQYQFLVKAEV